MRALSTQERYQFIRAYRHAVDQVLDVLDDRLENLAIASNPEVCAAIEWLIAEATGYRDGDSTGAEEQWMKYGMSI
jgi:hypothetical protein